jgi:hypothetical protein
VVLSLSTEVLLYQRTEKEVFTSAATVDVIVSPPEEGRSLLFN